MVVITYHYFGMCVIKMWIFQIISLVFGDDGLFEKLYIVVKFYGQGVGQLGTIGDKVHTLSWENYWYTQKEKKKNLIVIGKVNIIWIYAGVWRYAKFLILWRYKFLRMNNFWGLFLDKVSKKCFFLQSKKNFR